jgi:hypothetical protein
MREIVVMTQNFDFELSELAVLSRLASSHRQPNLLILCNQDARAFVASQAATWCQAPLHVCSLPGPLTLPKQDATVILNDVATLTLSQQIEVFDWMSYHPAARVVSITSTDVCDLLQEGAFLEGLYYRLNTLRIEAKEQLPLRSPGVAASEAAARSYQ